MNACLRHELKKQAGADLASALRLSTKLSPRSMSAARQLVASYSLVSPAPDAPPCDSTIQPSPGPTQALAASAGAGDASPTKPSDSGFCAAHPPSPGPNPEQGASAGSQSSKPASLISRLFGPSAHRVTDRSRTGDAGAVQDDARSPAPPCKHDHPGDPEQDPALKDAEGPRLICPRDQAVRRWCDSGGGARSLNC